VQQVEQFIREYNVRAVFAEPQFPAGSLRALAERTGVAVGRLDPLGGPNVPGYDSYIDLMRSNLDALASSLAEGAGP
jgi:ABC-type Zn uptake system ZnuABC Zn-binding protein ZnuA